MLPRGGRVYRFPPGRGLPDVPMPGVGGGMLSVPYDMGGLPLRDAGVSQPVPIGALATALANATPEQQRTVKASLNLLVSVFLSFCYVGLVMRSTLEIMALTRVATWNGSTLEPNHDLIGFSWLDLLSYWVISRLKREPT